MKLLANDCGCAYTSLMEGKPWHNLTRRPFALALSAVALGIVARGTLTPAPPGRTVAPSQCFLCAEVFGTDVLLNILLFIPLGLGMRLAGASRRGALAISAVVTVAVELTQWLFVSGRIASVADLGANILGAAVGMLLAERGHRLLFPAAGQAGLLACAGFLGWLVVQTLTVWAFAPSLRGDAFWGQIAADLGHMDRFTGRVISAGMAGTRLTDGRMKDDGPLRRFFDDGSAVRAIVVAGEPTARLAPIVSIFNGEQSEIVVLGQDGRDLVFRIRTHSTNARLRTPTVNLWGAFPPRAPTGDGHPRDTLLIAGWRRGWRMHVSVIDADTSATSSIALRPSFGWALMLPFEHTGTPLSWRYTAVWLAILLFPAGYWGAWVFISLRDKAELRSALGAAARVLTMLAFAASVLTAGLVALPLRLGLPAAGSWEWGGALSGIAIGTVAGFLSYWVSPSRLRRSTE